eukprot:TRINITY_DN49733_c0_g1_i1.p1 TRINITY_DN49733_c0_g1~~TRINITY_DN49733_c0_g1_i1.p1  ORF type:complete len:115 (+),score=21.74 TRINITY_DN49733_c0_g1_i1:31-345(+)
MFRLRALSTGSALRCRFVVRRYESEGVRRGPAASQFINDRVELESEIAGALLESRVIENFKQEEIEKVLSETIRWVGCKSGITRVPSDEEDEEGDMAMEEETTN